MFFSGSNITFHILYPFATYLLILPCNVLRNSHRQTCDETQKVQRRGKFDSHWSKVHWERLLQHIRMLSFPCEQKKLSYKVHCLCYLWSLHEKNVNILHSSVFFYLWNKYDEADCQYLLHENRRILLVTHKKSVYHGYRGMQRDHDEPDDVLCN